MSGLRTPNESSQRGETIEQSLREYRVPGRDRELLMSISCSYLQLLVIINFNLLLTPRRGVGNIQLRGQEEHIDQTACTDSTMRIMFELPMYCHRLVVQEPRQRPSGREDIPAERSLE